VAAAAGCEAAVVECVAVVAVIAEAAVADIGVAA
jgi:hypothetical protein